jgi:hypothetical protein
VKRIDKLAAIRCATIVDVFAIAMGLIHVITWLTLVAGTLLIPLAPEYYRVIKDKHEYQD